MRTVEHNTSGHRVFISYNHLDTAIAQRVYWRLMAYGIDTWLDEHQLEAGIQLSTTLQQCIADSEFVVVIATNSAVQSTWVSNEIRFAAACTPPKRIIPFFIDAVQKAPLLTDYLGIDATDIHQVESLVRQLADVVRPGTILAPNHEFLGASLRGSLQELTSQTPALVPLIDGCLSGTGFLWSDADGVASVPFHALDFAVNALYDIATAEQQFAVAAAAVLLFSRTGAGVDALQQYVTTHRELDGLMRSAVGGKLNPREHDSALQLLAACAPPQDDALRNFIENNGTALTDAARATLIRIVLNPPRAPRASADEAAFAALRIFPGRADLRLLWSHWISDGRFDGTTDGEGTPEALAGWTVAAQHARLDGWSAINAVLVTHVRLLVGTRDRERIYAGLRHLRAHADADSALMPEIFEACRTGASKLDGWSDQQPMAILVRTHLDAAMGDRNWRTAWSEYEATWSRLQRPSP